MASYSPSDISALLQVKESTLRKYSLLLEECGYKFDRNDQKQRWYSDKDVIAFQKLVTFKQNGDMNLKSCAEAVYLWSRGGDITEVSTDTHSASERHNSDITTPMIHQEMVGIRELIEEQRELIKSLYEQLERQDASQKERDRMLLNSIEQLQTDFQQQRDENKAIEQKMLQAPLEEKTSFWNRLFKK